MSKRHKKRNKPYTGADAVQAPTVRRYQVSEKSKARLWWEDNKQGVIIRSVVSALALGISWAIYVLVW